MTYNLPDYLSQGEAARLFPVLSTTSKEGRTTSIVLACMVQIEELGAALLHSIGQKRGKRAQVQAYTEVVFKNQSKTAKDRPDGLILLKVGSREWRALVETKVGNNALDADQIERYRALAKDNDIDCVITISNQFATTPTAHPVEEVRKSRSKLPVYHWSWMHVVTTAELLIRNEQVKDPDQLLLLNELRRFLNHESAGVQGFHKMPKEWGDLNKLVSSGGVIPARSPEAQVVLDAWHQETRDLSLILSRLVETSVSEKLPRKHINDPGQRKRDELLTLRERNQLRCTLDVPNTASPIEVTADLKRRCVDVGMTLRAPEDKKSTKARLNWLLRQIKVDNVEGLHIRLLWPGASEPTQHLVADLREDIEICQEGKNHLVAHGFHVFLSKRLGGRFTQQVNFISDLEEIVPMFYGEIGANLSVWKKAAPRINQEKPTAEDVSIDAIAEDAEEFVN
ncbi:hypothetical protein [Roseibium sp. MMSF_3412]|uniref:hypothetical protein n=1 Tax=Roseibium sp. MMSF_3412 TaxID=3046712 RepID=UPI00273DF2A9|nr:hypothetical protein [Roseibium sp. MMSF_3412]